MRMNRNELVSHGHVQQTNESFHVTKQSGSDAIHGTPLELADKIKKLETSLTFAMSLGNSEAFHSNVWDWLIRRDSRYASVFFPQLAGCACTSKREKCHRDLTITKTADANGLFVIENKIKAMPDRKQLIRHQESIVNSGQRFVSGVLTSVESPNWHIDGWRFMELDQIAKGLLSVSLDEPNIFIREIIRNYCECLELFCDIVKSSVGVFDGRIPAASELSPELEPVRLNSIVLKLAAARFAAKVQATPEFERLERELDSNGLSIRVENGFGRSGQATVSLYVPDSHSSMYNGIALGVSIDGSRFCRCVVITPTGNYNMDLEAKKDLIASRFRALNWFDSKGYGWRKGLVSSQKEKPGYSAYSSRDYLFVYQYVNIFSWPFDRVVDCLVSALHHVLLSDVVKVLRSPPDSLF